MNLYVPARPGKPRNSPRQSTYLCCSGSVLPIIIRTLIIIQRLSCNCQFADLCPAGRAGPPRSANSQNRSVYRRPAASLYGNRPGHGVQRAANRQLQDRRWLNARGGLKPGGSRALWITSKYLEGALNLRGRTVFGFDIYFGVNAKCICSVDCIPRARSTG